MLLVDGRADDLLSFTQGAVGLFPEDPEIRLIYATALAPQSAERARWEAAQAIQLDTHDPGRLIRAARLMLNLGEVETARAYARRAAQLAPANFPFAPELHAVSGVLAAISGDYGLAEDALRAAHEAEPDRATFARDLARLLDSRGRKVEALGVVEAAIAAGADPKELEKVREEISTGGESRT